MSENATHLLIPFASVSSEAATKYLQGLELPNLRQLLSALTLVDSDIGIEESFSPPHERALARVQGLPVADGCIPWAAKMANSRASVLGLENAQTLPWSFITLCHSVVGIGSGRYAFSGFSFTAAGGAVLVAAPIPVPATLPLVVLALLGLGARRGPARAGSVAFNPPRRGALPCAAGLT